MDIPPAPTAPSHLPLLSATQIKLWNECKRKWGFKYIERRVIPTHPGALLGTEVQDTQLDPWLGDARPFDFSRPSGEIANALVPLLPKAQTPGMRLRRKFTMPSPGGQFWYQGEFDIFAEDSGCVPGLEGGRPLLGDIKTTSNLAYALTTETLATDVQAMLYAADVMFSEELADELDLVWWYARTRKPHRVQRTHLRVVAPHVAEQFGRIDEIGAAIAAIKLAPPKVEDLPPNPRQCDAYGGCPYRPYCNLSPSAHAAAWNQLPEGVNVEQKTNDFLAGLRKVVPAAPANMGNPHPMAARSDIPPAPEALPSWATAPVDPLTGHRSATAAINPPESALPPAPPVGVAAPVEAPKRRGRPAKDPNASAQMTHVEPTVEGPGLADVETLVVFMTSLNIRRLRFPNGFEIEVKS